MAEMGVTEDKEVVSSTEGGIVRDTSSGPWLIRAVIFDCGNL